MRSPVAHEGGWVDLLGRGNDLIELARLLTNGVIRVGPEYLCSRILSLLLLIRLPLSIFFLLRRALQVIASFVVNNLRKFVFSADKLNLMLS